MTKIDPPGDPIRFVLRRLTSAGHQAYIVGGAVRNAILGLPVKDFDIATDATPMDVIAAFEDTDAQTRAYAAEYGTVLVNFQGVSVEVTTFRKDVETDGRRAVVSFSTDIREDASRRDFTMNAIYARIDGSIVDPLAGMQDLMDRHLRFVGSALRRIREDKLRMLRLFRFYAHLSQLYPTVDDGALLAVKKLAHTIDVISIERVTMEILSLLQAPVASRALKLMSDTGLLEQVVPNPIHGRLKTIEAAERRLGIQPDPLCRFAAINGRPEQLRLDKKSLKRLNTLTTEAPMGSIEALGYKYGIEDGLGLMLIHHADNVPMDIMKQLEFGARQVAPVKARHLPGHIVGKDIRDTLRWLEGEWLASGFKLTKEQLIKTIRTDD